MKGAVLLAQKMGFFLFYVGSVSPSATAAEETTLYCHGVNNQSYTCESGHCCGQSQCCSYYYELWWFWLVWAIIFILSCFCVCHHRRTKHRLQQQQRQHEINLIAYREAHNYTSLPFYFRFLPNYLLPDYEEVVNRPPTPPPPYSALNSSPPAASSPMTTEQSDGLQPPMQTAPAPAVCDTLSSRHSLEDHSLPAEYIQKEDSKAQLDPEQCGPELAASALEKEPLRDLGPEGYQEDKERSTGRHRRFTGDSGIEVCLCNQVQDGEGLQELDELLGDGLADFCDGCASCSLRGSGDEELGQAELEGRVERPAVCLLLHTINEQDGPNQAGSIDSQS
ncbi:WW domain binding protein 1-like [Arapaima gigas]